MTKLFFGLMLAFFTACAAAAADLQCTEYEKLRTQRDKALKAKDAKQYCGALSGLMKLHPATQTDPAKLKCEAVTTNGNVDTWLKIRPDIIATMKDTYSQQCK